MDVEQKTLREKSFDVNKHLIDKVWEDRAKGLRKEVINFRYCSIVKATELSKCLVDILNMENLKTETHKTNYILKENIGKELWIEMGHAVTPVDCYVEEFLKQMLTNETSNCHIETKSCGTISFTLRLKRIENYEYFYEQDAVKMFELSKLYKENGVKMFKEYPLFAHNYFSLAAKCLLAFSNYNGIDMTLKDTNVTKANFEELLQNIYLNISACLIKEGRFEEVIPILQFVRNQEQPSDKAVFRLATAYLSDCKYEEAKSTIEKIDYKSNKDLLQLMMKIQQMWKNEKDKDSVMAKKMLFG